MLFAVDIEEKNTCCDFSCSLPTRKRIKAFWDIVELTNSFNSFFPNEKLFSYTQSKSGVVRGKNKQNDF